MASVSKNYKGRPGYIISYYDYRGNRKRKVVNCSKKEADMIATEIESKKNRFILGIDKEAGENFAFPKAVNFYFSRNHKADNTEDRERRVYKAFMNYAGMVRIREIDQKHMMNYFLHRKEVDGITEATLGLEFRTFRAFFNFFVEQNYLSVSPMKGLKSPKVKDKPIRFLSITEINNLIDVIDDNNYRDLILMYINTGARRLEILKNNFTWDDIDFENRSITLHGKGNKVRTIPLVDIAYEILNRRKNIENRQYPFDLDYDAIFPRIKKYYKKANIKDANIHTLRKTFGSLLVQQEVNIFTVSKLMGHSNVLVTEKHYAGLSDKTLREAIIELDNLPIRCT